MLRAEPWLKSALLDGSKESSVRPSKPTPKATEGSVQLPKSRAEALAAEGATAAAAGIAKLALEAAQSEATS